ncbi:hypothetical protein BHE74_00001469 [Ensete ventricosum]|nr:hypothetical protein BHE74_00001469 [Ensete ventricosum]
MGIGDLLDDVQPQAEPGLGRIGDRPRIGVKEFRQGLFAYLAGVFHRQVEMALFDLHADLDRAIITAMMDGIGDQVGEQLRQPFPVASDALKIADIRSDFALRVHALYLRHHVLQRGLQALAIANAQGNPVAHASPCEIQYVFHQLGCATTAGEDVPHDVVSGGIGVLAQQPLGAEVDGKQRVAQIVPKHGDELLAQFGGAAFFVQVGFGALLAFFGFDLQRQHAGKRLHGRLDRAAAQLRGVGVQGADSAEKTPIGTEHRNGNVAFEPVDPRGVVVVVERVFAGFVDHHRHVRATDFVTKGGGQVQFASHAEAEFQLVEHRAGRPGVLRHAGDRGKPQAGHVADDFEHGRHRADAADGGDVGGFLPHVAVSIWLQWLHALAHIGNLPTSAHKKTAPPWGGAVFRGLNSRVLLVFQHFAGLGVEFHLPLHVAGITHFDFVHQTTSLVVQLGVGDGRAGMFGQGISIELFEGFDGTGLEQARNLVRANVRLGEAGGQGQGGGGEQCGQGFHGVCPSETRDETVSELGLRARISAGVYWMGYLAAALAGTGACGCGRGVVPDGAMAALRAAMEPQLGRSSARHLACAGQRKPECRRLADPARAHRTAGGRRRLATGLAAVGATVTGHRARRRRYHPDALRQPPHRAAVALACGASQRATVVWIQWFDETPFAPDARSHCWAAAVDPAGHSVGRGAVAGLGDCHSVAVAALQCGHARGALALGIRVGAGASFSPYEIRPCGRCEFWAVFQPVGLAAGHGVLPRGLSHGARGPGDWQPPGFPGGVWGADAGPVQACAPEQGAITARAITLTGGEGTLQARITQATSGQLAQCLQRQVLMQQGGDIKHRRLGIQHRHFTLGIENGVGLPRRDKQAPGRGDLAVQAHRDRCAGAAHQLVCVVRMGRSAPQLADDQAVVTPQPQAA